MAKKGGSGSNPSADLLASISKDAYNQTDPLRKALLGRSMSFLGLDPNQLTQAPQQPPPQLGNMFSAMGNRYGSSDDQAAYQEWQQHGESQPVPSSQSMSPVSQTPYKPIAFDPSQSFMFGPAKTAIETQYQRAKDDLISSSPAGGALSSNLADLEGQKANSLAATMADITQQEYNTALGFATGGTTQAMSGLGSAAAIQAQIQAAKQAKQGAAKQGIGTGVGYMLGGPVGGAVGGKAGGGG